MKKNFQSWISNFMSSENHQIIFRVRRCAVPSLLGIAQPKVALKNLGGNIRETLSFGDKKVPNLEVQKKSKNDPEK